MNPHAPTHEGKTPGRFNISLPHPLKDERLIEKVFVHSSYLNESKDAGLESNERLEFLGDAVLSLAISRTLYEAFPGAQEGELTNMRAKLVNKTALAGLAEGLGLGGYLLLSKGERASGGAENPAILAGVFEALIGAVYLEWGTKKTFAYIKALFKPLMESVESTPGHFDFKPMLQELCQKAFKSTPAYRLVSETGPAHKKMFEVEAVIGGEVFGRGSASRKKDAEQSAAETALKRLRKKGLRTGD